MAETPVSKEKEAKIKECSTFEELRECILGHISKIKCRGKNGRIEYSKNIGGAMFCDYLDFKYKRVNANIIFDASAYTDSHTRLFRYNSQKGAIGGYISI